jgi:hypothetical protein
LVSILDETVVHLGSHAAAVDQFLDHVLTETERLPLLPDLGGGLK